MRRFDVIIVGAGPAGLTAALVLARAGMNVVVLERGEYPGAKNMFGGVLYCKGLHELLPDFWERAPLERPVTRWVIGFLDKGSCLSLEYQSRKYGEAPYNAFSVLRSRFDRWYAQQVEAEGVTLVTETTVESLISEGSRIVGVRTDRAEGEVFADVVIAADGVNSLVVRTGLLRRELSPHEVSLGVKEVLSLPKGMVNTVFGLNGNEGAAYLFVGESTQGRPGGGFIYTNRETVSIGVVVKVSSLSQGDRRPEDMLEEFKHHPVVWPLVKNGETREYLAHLIPDGRMGDHSRLYKGGLLAVGDAAGFTLSLGFRVEGANLSILSGIAAGETVKRAFRSKDFSEKGLSVYPQILKELGVLSGLERFKRAHQFFKNPRLYRIYPEMACRLGESLFTVEPGPKRGFGRMLKEAWKGRVSRIDMIKDFLAGWRGLG